MALGQGWLGRTGVAGEAMGNTSSGEIEQKKLHRLSYNLLGHPIANQSSSYATEGWGTYVIVCT